MIKCRKKKQDFTTKSPAFGHTKRQTGKQKANSWTYNFVEVSGHNLEISQT